MAKKDKTLKLWLISKTKKNRKVPNFAFAKSGRKAKSKNRRDWRTDKLNTKMHRYSIKRTGTLKR